MDQTIHIRDLINRLARLDAATAWSGDLNPAQQAALDYLGQANRFSRQPSHVAEYLGTTRGTVSQTFKSLIQKGYVMEHRSDEDKRAIRLDLTAKGTEIAAMRSLLSDALSDLKPDRAAALQTGLSEALIALLARNSGRAFGVCATCTYHVTRQGGGFCSLLGVALKPEEARQLCHEHRASGTASDAAP